MISRVKKLFKNLRFQNKIIGISLLISLIPTILLGTFSYYQMRSALLEREQTAVHETLQQKAMQLDYNLNSYVDIITYIVWNENLRSALTKEYTSNYEMYLTYNDIIDPMFLTMRSLNTDIQSITIFTDVDIYPHGDSLRPLDECEQYEWYTIASESTSPLFYYSEADKSLQLICKMYYQYSPKTSIICMNINLDTFFNSTTCLFSNDYSFFIYGPGNSIIYEYNCMPSVSTAESASYLLASPSGDYISDTYSLEHIDWKVCIYRPTKVVLVALQNIAYIVIGMIILCIILTLLASRLLSKVIVTPIIKLSDNIDQIEQGNYNIDISSDSHDEVGHLITSFQKMVHTINNLINEVLLGEIRQQQYEIELLQSKINPHFLYNSLSLINSKALLAGQKDISLMVRYLSTFYRTMLNKGQQITTIAKEIDNTQSYISIQQMMHSQSFEVNYDIDESLLEYKIPNLVLQPLAENAIVHGLDHKETPGQATLSISCYRDDKDIVFKIMDNGRGMSEEECADVLNKDSKGYGVQNVNKRIQLYYGTNYGLSYRSTQGMGTYVILRINDSLT